MADEITTDWRSILDPQSNSYYYWNMKTNETRWDNPFDSADYNDTAVSDKVSQELPNDIDNQGTTEGDSGQIVNQEDLSYEDLYLTGHQSAAISSLNQILDGVDHRRLAMTQGIQVSDVSSSNSAAQGVKVPTDHVVKGHFNARTGKFEANPLENNPAAYSLGARAVKQMNQYFDYNSWADQRSREINRENAKPQKKKKLTKREVATFKKQKKEKDRIKKAWLFED